MGGMQIIVIADFYQLPLVPNKWISDQGKYCFKSERCIIILHKAVLKDVQRQEQLKLIQAVKETARDEI